MIESFGDLLARWTAAELRDDLGVSYHTAASMKRRGSVATMHWPNLIEAAGRKGILIDAATLMGFRRALKAPPAVNEAA